MEKAEKCILESDFDKQSIWNEIIFIEFTYDEWIKCSP